MNGFTVVVTAVQLLRAMGRANDSVYYATPEQMRNLCAAIGCMYGRGCQFTDEDLSELTDGEQAYVEERYSRYHGFSSLHNLLNEIFDQMYVVIDSQEDGLYRAQGM